MKADAILIGAMAMLPCAIMFAWRYIALQAALDAQARRDYILKSAIFSCAGCTTTIMLAAGRGSLAAPVAWQLAVSVVSFKLALGLIKGKKRSKADNKEKI